MTESPHARMSEQQRSQLLQRLREQLGLALRGKPKVLEYVLACVLSRGHLLLEDLPGSGKTTLAKGLAAALGGRFSRVQCTPDLLPGDITGFSVFNQKSREFEFLPGPVFADVLLADEINRAMPRTQSALLEAMAERQVTVDNTRHALSEQFFVVATQNPVEHHGTYPLPEAQLDRFAMKLSIGYPDRADEAVLLQAAVEEGAPSQFAAEPLLSRGQLADLQTHTARLTVAANVRNYLLDLAQACRSNKNITLGLSPRGLLTWQRVSQAWAVLQGRDFVTPDDVQAVALPVLQVRLGIDPDASARTLEDVLASVSIPVTRAA